MTITNQLPSSSDTKIKFPLGIASGEYFCNRVCETKLLVNNILSCVHTVLLSPRRYGKTSLAYRAMEKANLPSAKVDLYLTTSEKQVESVILKAISSLISQTRGSTEEILSTIKNYLKTLKPVFEAGPGGLKIKLEPTEKSITTENIKEALQILDSILQKKSINAVLLLDEFQELQNISPESGIEGAIRHVAQETKNLSIIFSGSNRNMLKAMFNNKSKPLYKLCDEIYLDRIHQRDYKPFIAEFSKQRWGKALEEPTLNQIIELSELHPYYFNLISNKLFYLDYLPSVNDVNIIWQELLIRKRKDLLAEIRNLNLNQKKILVAIANGIDNNLTSQRFLSSYDISSATAIRSLEYLQENDLIAKFEDESLTTNTYYIIDPLLKSMIIQQDYI